MNIIKALIFSFTYQGWINHDIIITIFYIITALSGYLLLKKFFTFNKNKDYYNYSDSESTSKFSSFVPRIIFLLFILTFFYITLVWSIGSGPTRGKLTFTTPFKDKTQNYVKINNSLIFIARTSKNKKTGNSTSTSYNSFAAIDTSNGKTLWTKYASYHDEIISIDKDRIVILDYIKKRIKIINPKTGKLIANNSTFENKNLNLKKNWSNEKSDYTVNHNFLYMHALDDEYYKIDLQTLDAKKINNDSKEITINNNTNLFEIFLNDAINEITIDGTTNEKKNKIKKTKFISPIIIDNSTLSKNYIFYIHSETRDEKSNTLVSIFDIENNKVLWTKNLKVNLLYKNETNIIENDERLLLTSSGYLFAINKKNGNIIYKYDFAYHRVVK